MATQPPIVAPSARPVLPGSDPLAGACILGIDPGLQRTGYAVLTVPNAGAAPTIREAGVIRLPRGDSLEARLVELDTKLLELLHGFHPRILACEALYAHYKHPRTAILMGHARGVILVAAARCGLEIVSVAATNSKKLLTGSGHATKAQVQRAIAHTLGLLRPPEPNDVADAIAIALAGLRLAEAHGKFDAADRTAKSSAKSGRGHSLISILTGRIASSNAPPSMPKGALSIRTGDHR